LLETRYRMRSFADIDATLLVLPELEENDRVRVQFDASLSFDLYSDFDFKMTVYDRYDSQPPVANEKNDYGVTLGLSWSY
jgi:putative salt-induced outer membrane protein YdiY